MKLIKFIYSNLCWVVILSPALLMTLTVGSCDIKPKPVIYQPMIDLPDNYSHISQNENHPDTMIGFYKGNTIYFRFVADRH